MTESQTHVVGLSVCNGISLSSQFQVDAFDGEGRSATVPASVTVTVNRNQFPPVFTNPSFLVNLNYTTNPGTQVFDADATDADTQVRAPRPFIFCAVILNYSSDLLK